MSPVTVPQACRVLLLDDDPIMSKTHAIGLGAAGMNVQAVAEPRHLLEVLGSFDPHVVIADFDMAAASGPELLAVLRERSTGQHMAVIFLSPETDINRQVLALTWGADDLLLKSLSTDHLVAVVSARVNRARQAAATQAQLEAALYERERVHTALNQHANVSITDNRGNIIFVNDRFCEISGYQRHELLGANHRLIKSGLHDAGFYKNIWHTIMRGEVWQGEICNRRKDGTLYWVATTITPFVDGSDGNPYQYVAIRTDITKIKARELEQQRLSALKQLIGEAASRLMAASPNQIDQAVESVLELTGRFLGAERANLFQYSLGTEKVTHSHEWCDAGVVSQKALIQDADVSGLPWWLNQVRSGALIRVSRVEEWPAEADAEKAFFTRLGIHSVIGFPINTEGNLSGLLGFASLKEPDKWQIQELKLLQVVADLISSALKRCEAQRQAESHKEMLRLGQLFANIGTWDWDIKTGRLFWTERIAPLFGFKEGEVETSYANFLTAVHPDDRSDVEQIVSRSLFESKPYEIEHRVVWPDGSVRWLLERGSVVRDSEGNPQQMIGVVQDIDARKQAEFALEAARQEAERANQAKTEFLSSMSHELRTPLNVILGFAQLLGYEEGLSADSRDSVQEILKSGNHLLALINELLDLAKIESGHLSICLEPINPDLLIRECVHQISPLMTARNLKVRVTGDSVLAVQADKKRLCQVLLNLLSNAVKYNCDGGQIGVDVSRHGDNQVMISVTDTGAGLDEADIALLFEPFNRLGQEKSAVEGTGIGLPICKKLVELMGGTITVSSVVGQGSSFCFTLPSAAIPDEMQ